MIGTELGNYRIVGSLGKGGMGHVYAAEHQLLGRRAAIKVLDHRFDDDETIKTRFFNEARAISQLRHPSIVEVYDFGHAPDGRAYLVMELLTGESLGRRMKRGAVPIEPTLVFARQIASALAEAHGQGIVHRDLKPDNVFIEADPEAPLGERAKVLDFGVAKHRRTSTRDGEHLTQTGVLLGTPAYMSPEQVNGRQVTRHSDIYSLGVMTYRMLTAVLPFDADDRADLLELHVSADPRPPTELNPDIPGPLEDIVLRCLAKRPSDRFDTMDDLAAALGAVLQQPGIDSLGAPTDKVVPVGTSQPRLPLPPPDTGPVPLDDPTTLRSSAGERTGPFPTRRAWPVWLAAAAVLVTATAFALTRAEDPAPTPTSTPAPTPTTNTNTANVPETADVPVRETALLPDAAPTPPNKPEPSAKPNPKPKPKPRAKPTPRSRKPKPPEPPPNPEPPKRQDFEQPVY